MAPSDLPCIFFTIQTLLHECGIVPETDILQETVEEHRKSLAKFKSNPPNSRDPTDAWLVDQLVFLRASWNRGPFDRTVKRELSDKLPRLSEKISVPTEALEACVEKLKANSRKRLVLAGAIELTVKQVKSDEVCAPYSQILEKTLRRKLKKLMFSHD